MYLIIYTVALQYANNYLTVQSAEPDAIYGAFDATAMQRIPFVCLSIVFSTLPFSNSHVFTLLSKEPDTRFIIALPSCVEISKFKEVIVSL